MSQWIKTLSSFHLLTKKKEVRVLSHSKCIFGPANAFRSSTRGQWLLTSFNSLNCITVLRRLKLYPSKDACLACFSAKEKDPGSLFGLFFVYFSLFVNYSDSREHYKTLRLFSLTKRCLMQTLWQSFLTVCVTFL